METMELEDREKRRAHNLIWNAAGDYTFQPDCTAYDRDGHAERYWNSIIGAARKQYDWSQLQALFHSFEGCDDQVLYENLLWLGLENGVFLREEANRPALSMLRRIYARQVSATAALSDQLMDIVEAAHFKRVLGEDPKLLPLPRLLLDSLEYGPELDTAEIVRRTDTLFREHLGFVPVAEKKKESRFSLPRFLFRGASHRQLPQVRAFAFGVGYFQGSGGDDDNRLLSFRLPTFSTQTEAGLRAFIGESFGPPLYEDARIRKLESALCTGSHQTCHLYFTQGFQGVQRLSRGPAGDRQRETRKQREKNLAYYHAHLDRNRSTIRCLAERIQNALLMLREPESTRGTTGRLEAGRIWRATCLDDRSIFRRTPPGDEGDLSVDILLDASSSQSSRQEIISTQAHIIAESLAACHIPVRVYAFSSMSGYTILQLLRDYDTPAGDEGIFRYATAGCNRDGLALRTVTHLLLETRREHRMLIILSDVRPNDVVKIRDIDGEARLYNGEVGIWDMAAEVRKTRFQSIAVMCVFTGEDTDLPAARMVYGRDFVRIRNLDQFAETVGSLIQNQIASL